MVPCLRIKGSSEPLRGREKAFCFESEPKHLLQDAHQQKFSKTKARTRACRLDQIGAFASQQDSWQQGHGALDVDRAPTSSKSATSGSDNPASKSVNAQTVTSGQPLMKSGMSGGAGHISLIGLESHVKAIILQRILSFLILWALK